MVRSSILIAALATASSVTAAAASVACSESKLCPETAPCCSQYGQCGAGAYCLGGCDPLGSFSLKSCVPEPVCKDTKTTFNSKAMDRITSKIDYLGDSSKTDWVMDGEAVPFDDSVLLTMPVDSVGTLLASSTYMWYGNVKATFRTSRGQGVVTAFILLSDVKDEIDYEFVGADLETAQTNFYWHGVPNYHNSKNITLSNTFDNFHTYEIDWTPDSVTWKIDDQVGRIMYRKDTWNATSNRWDFPQTPARVQLSLWPGGLPSNGKGTVDWAGGLVDWNSEDIKDHKYYYAAFQSVEISCFNGKSAPGTNNGKSYTYNNLAGTNNTVVDGNGATVLKSFLGTGTDMNAGESTDSAADPSATIETIPGLSGAGVGSNNHDDGTGAASTDSGSSGSGSSDTSGTGSGSDGAQGSTSNTGFTQGTGSDSGTSKTTTNGADRLGVSQEKVLKGSMFAGIIAVVAMMAL